VSSYPAAPGDANLRAMDTLAARFQVPVGFSDHTLGIEVALAAVARGACVLEKHVTLDRTSPGPDHAASLEPAEFAELVRGVRRVEAALGHGRKEPAAAEADVARVARRSLVAACDIPEGATLTAGVVTALRPGTGLSPALLPSLLGRRARHAIGAGTLLTRDMLS
jgi:sialic acid synthase SpsE